MRPRAAWLRTLVWNSDDVADVLASLVRDEQHYTFMELPRDPAGIHVG